MPAHDDPRTQRLLEAQEDAERERLKEKNARQQQKYLEHEEMARQAPEQNDREHDEYGDDPEADQLAEPTPFQSPAEHAVLEPDDPSIVDREPQPSSSDSEPSNETAAAAGTAANGLNNRYDPNAPWGDPGEDDRPAASRDSSEDDFDYSGDRDNPSHAVSGMLTPVSTPELADTPESSTAPGEEPQPVVENPEAAASPSPENDPADFRHFIKAPVAAQERASRTPFSENPFAPEPPEPAAEPDPPPADHEPEPGDSQDVPGEEHESLG